MSKERYQTILMDSVRPLDLGTASHISDLYEEVNLKAIRDQLVSIEKSIDELKKLLK